MSGFVLPGSFRHGAFCLVACAWLACTPARAQLCGGDPGPARQKTEGERFGLLAEQCPGLAGPLKPHRAAQLDLYSRPAGASGHAADASPAGSLPTTTGASAAAPPAEPSAAEPSRRREAPTSRDAARVISLAPAITETA